MGETIRFVVDRGLFKRILEHLKEIDGYVKMHPLLSLYVMQAKSGLENLLRELERYEVK